MLYNCIIISEVFPCWFLRWFAFTYQKVYFFSSCYCLTSVLICLYFEFLLRFISYTQGSSSCGSCWLSSQRLDGEGCCTAIADAQWLPVDISLNDRFTELFRISLNGRRLTVISIGSNIVVGHLRASSVIARVRYSIWLSPRNSGLRLDILTLVAF